MNVGFLGHLGFFDRFFVILDARLGVFGIELLPASNLYGEAFVLDFPFAHNFAGRKALCVRGLRAQLHFGIVHTAYTSLALWRHVRH
jgi:hypothetical protein